MRIKLVCVSSATLVATVLLLGSIYLQDSAVAAESTVTENSDPMQLARGAKSWADTCSRCHNMRDARSLRDDQWRAAIAHMRVRAGLTAQEANDVLVFLQQSN